MVRHTLKDFWSASDIFWKLFIKVLKLRYWDASLDLAASLNPKWARDISFNIFSTHVPWQTLIYVLVIARCRVQYFTGFDYFATYFRSFYFKINVMVEYISTSFKKLVLLLNILNSINSHSCSVDRKFA